MELSVKVKSAEFAFPLLFIRLRDLSNSEKHEHQRAIKEKEKMEAELKETKSKKDSINKALKVCTQNYV